MKYFVIMKRKKDEVDEQVNLTQDKNNEKNKESQKSLSSSYQNIWKPSQGYTESCRNFKKNSQVMPSQILNNNWEDQFEKIPSKSNTYNHDSFKYNKQNNSFKKHNNYRQVDQHYVKQHHNDFNFRNYNDYSNPKIENNDQYSLNDNKQRNQQIHKHQNNKQYYPNNDKKDNWNNNGYYFEDSRNQYSKNNQAIQRGKRNQKRKKEQQHKVSSTTVEFFPDNCLICLESIRQDDKIWNCRKCQVLLHFNCFSSWTQKQNALKKLSEKPTYACPHCFDTKTQSELINTCFCGKKNEPKRKATQFPNSCRAVCERIYDNCGHLCEAICHFGTCPPCNKTSIKICYCGKSRREVICNKASPEGESCEEVCGNLLNCKKHRCKKICHSGDCNKCEISELKKCVCGKTEIYSLCGEIASCKEICGKRMNCGNHFCSKICHKSGDCNTCDSKTLGIINCKCGKKSTYELLHKEELGCLDEQPSCNQICDNKLPCGHNCTLICHTGPCSCGNKVEKSCLCGRKEIQINCSSASDVILCNTICEIKLPCNKHKCLQECCLLSPKEHECKKICREVLSCGEHECGRKCHKGKCKPCDAKLSKPLVCACGAEVILPPVLCGTQIPTCERQCRKELPCEHLCYYRCHFGNCPPCEELVTKKCLCGNTTINKVKCSKDVKCTSLCSNVMSCGHFCSKICHKIGKCEDERKEMRNILKLEAIKESNSLKMAQSFGCCLPCGKKRKDCNHLCDALCHPEIDCPITECTVICKATCSCGCLNAQIPCHLVAIPIPCTDQCKNYKRFRALYDAEAGFNDSYYSQALVNFASSNHKLLKSTEDKINVLFLEGNSELSFSVGKDSEQKAISILQLLKQHYRLEAHYVRTDSRVVITVIRGPDFIIPKEPLSVYAARSMEIKSKPFAAEIRFYNLSVFDRPRQLEELVDEFKEYCYIERTGGMLILFIRKENIVEPIEKILLEQRNNWSSFVIQQKSDKKPEPMSKASCQRASSPEDHEPASQLPEEIKNPFEVLSKFN